MKSNPMIAIATGLACRLVGFFKNVTANGTATYFSGAGVRYAFTLASMIFASGKKVQDSLAVEGGLFMYKLLGYASDSDAYTVLPLLATVRYNLLMAETFGIFFYGGMMNNRVTQSSNAAADKVAQLQRPGLALGGGLLFRIGPSWEARVDIGTDMIGTGLMLRF